MTQTPSPAGQYIPTPPNERRAGLVRLDDALVQVRRLLQRPGYRRRLRAALTVEVRFTTVRVLRVVERFADASPSVGEIAESLGVDPSSASRFVEDAVANGYLERRTCTHDLRRSRLHLTVAGRQLLATAARARRDLLDEVTEGWSDHDIEVLGDLLERLQVGFARLEEQP